MSVDVFYFWIDNTNILETLIVRADNTVNCTFEITFETKDKNTPLLYKN